MAWCFSVFAALGMPFFYRKNDAHERRCLRVAYRPKVVASLTVAGAQRRGSGDWRKIASWRDVEMTVSSRELKYDEAMSRGHPMSR